MDYKSTLLMPKTDFEMKGKLPTKEPKILEHWQELDLYDLNMKKKAGKTPFILHDGPPYANGKIHVGHGLNKILKDFVVRSKNMQDYFAPYIPGWDTHGLPIEVAITKSGVNRKELGVSEFRNLCAEYALKQIEIQKEGFLRLGSLGDYSNPYITLHKDYEAAQIRIFAKMIENKNIYQGFKPVYWSPSSETALAEGELEYYDREDDSIYIAFKVKEGNDYVPAGTALVCWTTMPWTLTGVVAVSVNKDFDYGLYETNFGNVIVAKGLAEDSFAKMNTPYKLIETIKGANLECLKVSNPLNDYECLVILGDHVSLEGGTGCVTTAPGHGTDDFIAAKKYDLELIVGCDVYGKMYPETGADIAGLYWEKANKVIIENLKNNNTLYGIDTITHSYPFDWRTKKPIIFRAAKQWFASIDAKREDILNQIENDITWTPSWGRTRMYNMIKDRGDWCISRQRVWGVPIPIFYDENEEPIIEHELFEHVATLFEQHGSNIWFEKEVAELLPESYKANHPNYVKYTKEKDIMDVWFDSGSSHTGCIINRGLNYPVDLYLEGSDQYRGWFNSSLIIGSMYHDQSPYKAVVSHGFVLDQKGNKMSKSLGNVVDPEKIINQYGADILRFWVSSVDYQSDVKIGDNIIKQVADAYRKVRNTFKFSLGNLNNFDETMLLDYKELTEVDQYLLIKLNKLNKACINAYNNYDYSTVYTLINNFIAKELSAFYMDFTKDILYILKEKDLRRVQVQTVLYQCVDTLMKLLAPILAFTMEEAYSYFPHTDKQESIHLELFNDVHDYANEIDVETKFDQFMIFRNDVLKAVEVARDEKIIGKSLEAELIINIKPEFEFIKELPDLAQLCIVSNIEFKENNGLDLDTAQIEVNKYDGYLCPRCWNIVSTDKVVGELCERCAEVLK